MYKRQALICGVWNGLVDAVSGLFAMVKMIFDGISLGADFAQNVDKYLPMMLEPVSYTHLDVYKRQIQIEL